MLRVLDFLPGVKFPGLGHFLFPPFLDLLKRRKSGHSSMITPLLMVAMRAGLV